MMVCRSRLHPDAPGLPLSGRHHGLGDPQGAGLAGVEHDRKAIPRRDVSKADREVEFCLEALEEALARHGRPEIFNTDPSAVC